MGETPDWRRLNATSFSFPVTDLGEVAARLGSIATFDRRGDVVFLDDMENGLGGWQTTLGGTGAAADMSFGRRRSGQASARLRGGSDGTRLASMRRTVPFAAAGRTGFEFSFSVESGVQQVDLGITQGEGTQLRTYNARWVASPGNVQVVDALAGNVTLLAGRQVDTGQEVWAAMKLVVDLETFLYERVLLNADAASATPYTPPIIVIGSFLDVRMTVQVTSNPGVNGTIYVDDAIVTQNEPPNGG